MERNKILCILLSVFIIIFMVSGCDTLQNQSDGINSTPEKALTASEVYQRAMLKQKDIKTADIDADYKFNMSYSEGSNEIGMNTNIKYDKTDNSNMKMMMTGTMNMSMTGETKISQIYVDNTIYVESAGMKFKSKVDAETGKSYIGEQNTEDIFGFASFSEMKISDEGENKKLEFKCEADQMNGFVKNIIEKYSGQTDGNYSFNDIYGSFIIDKDFNIKSMNVKMNAELMVDGSSMTMDMDINLILNSFGQPVEIVAPADAESYVEVDPSALNTTAAG